MALQDQRAHPAILGHAREVDGVDGARDGVGIGMHVNVDDAAEWLSVSECSARSAAQTCKVDLIGVHDGI